MKAEIAYDVRLDQDILRFTFEEKNRYYQMGFSSNMTKEDLIKTLLEFVEMLRIHD